MSVKYFCDDCGSDDNVVHLSISAEIGEAYFNNEKTKFLPVYDRDQELGVLPEYHRDLCRACLERRVMEYCGFINGLRGLSDDC
jgi:hypothetical protein